MSSLTISVLSTHKYAILKQRAPVFGCMGKNADNDHTGAVPYIHNVITSTTASLFVIKLMRLWDRCDLRMDQYQ